MMMYARGYEGARGCLGYGFAGGGYGSVLIMTAVILLIAVVIILVVKNNNVKKSENIALESLKMKLVQGEISEEDYIKIKKALNDK